MPFLARKFNKAKNDMFKINHAINTWMKLMFLLELELEMNLLKFKQEELLFLNNYTNIFILRVNFLLIL